MSRIKKLEKYLSEIQDDLGLDTYQAVVLGLLADLENDLEGLEIDGKEDQEAQNEYEFLKQMLPHFRAISKLKRRLK